MPGADGAASDPSEQQVKFNMTMSMTSFDQPNGTALHAPDDGVVTRTHDLRWRILAKHESAEGLEQWSTLEQRLDFCRLMASRVWVETWLRHYGDLIDCRILVFERDGVVEGLALVVTSREYQQGPFRLVTGHLGTAGEPDAESVCVEYNALLVNPKYEVDFYDGLVDQLGQQKEWDELRLDGFSTTDLQPLLDRLPAGEVKHRESRYFDFAVAREGGKDVISCLGKSTRANLRRRLREYGELDCTWAESLSEALEIFEELVQLHQERWTAVGEPGAFASRRFREFQEELITRLFLEDRCVLFRVRHEGTTVGCLMLLVDQNRLLDYLSGFVSFELKPSPGLVTHQQCMQAALDRGYDAYDFLVGDKRHKANLGTDSAELVWVRLARPTWKQCLVRSVKLARNVVRGALGKQTSQEQT